MTSQTVLLKPSAAVTTTTGAASAAIPVPKGCWGIRVNVKCTAATGTSPTLNVFIQDGIRDAGNAAAAGDTCDSTTYTYDDYIAFTQMTGAGERNARKDFGGEEESPVADAPTATALTAGQMRNGPLTDRIRAKWVVAGTNPSFTFSIRVVFLF